MYEGFLDSFRGRAVIAKLDYIWGLFLCILRSSFKIKIQNGDIFEVA